MKRLALATFALVALAASAGAQVIPPGTNPVPAGAAYNSSPPTCVTGSACWLQVDVNGQLKTTGSATLTGSTSNTSSGVATSATNIPAVSYNYGFNGTTWDQLQVDSNKNLLVGAGGAPTFTTLQVSVATSSTAVCPARTGRRACTITAITGGQQLFCSGTVATTANGQLIPAVIGANFTANTTAAINCITTVTAQTVSVAESY